MLYDLRFVTNFATHNLKYLKSEFWKYDYV